MKKVLIFCDGSCIGNPGVGAYASILKYKNTSKVIKGVFENTTNNKMELKGAIEALKLLKEPCDVEVISDSQYLVKGMTEWIIKWKNNGWKTSNKKPVLNLELWKELDELCKLHNVKFTWIKGHAGHPENEECDTIARLECEKFLNS